MGLFVSTRELSILALKSGFSSGDEPTLLAPAETQAIRKFFSEMSVFARNLYTSDSRIVNIFQYCRICDIFLFIPYNVLRTPGHRGEGFT